MKYSFSLILALSSVALSGCSTFRNQNGTGARAGQGQAAQVIGQPAGSQGPNQASRPAVRPTAQSRTRKPSTPSAPNPYSNPQRGLRNATVSIPKVIPAGSHYQYSSVPSAGKYLAITFDDGPHPTHTPRLLDMLAQRNIKATFFVVGKNAQAQSSIIRRMVREGHEIGNHTWTHANLNTKSKDSIRKEFADSSQAIFKATGIRPKLMRPPYGAFRTELRQWARSEFGYPTILWSVDPRDWADRNASTVTRRLVDGARPGGILLAHDIHKTTVDAMPNTLDGLLQRGYKFVTVSQLITLGSRGGSAARRPLPSAPYSYPNNANWVRTPVRAQTTPIQPVGQGPVRRSPNPSWNPTRLSWQ